MRRFPRITTGLLAASIAALFIVAYLTETHCSFGFGGMGCISPFVGWGDTFLTATLGLIGLVGILAITLCWQLFQCWCRRAPRPPSQAR